MKKTFYVFLGFAFCVTIPALAENYRAHTAHMATHGQLCQNMMSMADR